MQEAGKTVSPPSTSPRFSWVRTVFRLLVALFGLYSLGLGLWAFVAPASFSSNVALFPPFNQHLVHDLGAFIAGLGVALLLALVLSDALLTVLAANSAAAVLHTASHVMDRSLGGRPGDPVVVGLLAVVLMALTVTRIWMLRTNPTRGG